MYHFIEKPLFQRDYQALRHISLNPQRHLAANAYEHCELVVHRVLELCQLNQVTQNDTSLLIALAKVHDIGKVRGNAKPKESVDLLKKYGEFDECFINMVKYHDINLPWYIAMTKGQTPSDKAWRKLVAKVNFKLLCLFMIADRVDCPGGWEANKALVWFLEEANKKQYLDVSV